MKISIPAEDYARLSLGFFLTDVGAFTNIEEVLYLGSRDGLHFYDFHGDNAPRDDYTASRAKVEMTEDYLETWDGQPNGMECTIKACVPYGRVFAFSRCGEYTDDDSDASIHGLIVITEDPELLNNPSIEDFADDPAQGEKLSHMELGNFELDTAYVFEPGHPALGSFLLVDMEQGAKQLARKYAAKINPYDRPNPNGPSYFEEAFTIARSEYGLSLDFRKVESFLEKTQPAGSEDLVYIIGRHLSDKGYIHMDYLQKWVDQFPAIKHMRGHDGMTVMGQTALHGNLRGLEAAVLLGFDRAATNADGKTPLQLCAESSRDPTSKRAYLEKLLLEDSLAGKEEIPAACRKMRL